MEREKSKKHNKIKTEDIKYYIRKLTDRTWKKIGLVILGLLLLNSFAFLATGNNYIERGVRNVLYRVGIYTEEIQSVDISSSEWDEKREGSFHINKSAKWVDANQVDLTLDIDTVLSLSSQTRDVILVLDNSSSMEGIKLEQLKKDAKSLVETLLENENNRIAILTFGSSSSILSDFSSNKEDLIRKIESISGRGMRNFTAALKNVGTVMKNYTYTEEKELVTLFLTDGYPNEQTPNQNAEYRILKDKYPYMKIKGIQYEMGDSLIEALKNISDEQYVANINSLDNVLFEAAFSPISYKSLEISEFIDTDYFRIQGENDIHVSLGDVTLTEGDDGQNVIWSLSGVLKAGLHANMTIHLILKDEVTLTPGYYPVNKKMDVQYAILTDEVKTMTSSKTPVLRHGYNVAYDSNPPDGCNIKNIINETGFAYQVTMKRMDTLQCSGYLFKGFQVVEEDVKKINDESFIMPDHDITVRGVWTSLDTTKSMEGTVYERTTLWKAIKNKAEMNAANKKNDSTQVLRGTETDKYPIYYEYSSYNSNTETYTNTTNHVLFAGFCWKIVRTTETGGVKLVYNGVPNEGVCDNTGVDSQLSTTSQFNTFTGTMADIGYMYNDRYAIYSKNIIVTRRDTSIYHTYFMDSTSSNSRNIHNIAKSYEYVNGKYNLKDVTRGIYGSEGLSRDDYVGKYVCFTLTNNNSEYSTSCSTVGYVVRTSDFNFQNATAIGLDVVLLKDGETLEDVNLTYYIGNDYTSKEDGTYELLDYTPISRFELYIDANKHRNFYICDDPTKTVCDNIDYYYNWNGEYLSTIAGTGTTSGYRYPYYMYTTSNNYVFSNSVTYDGENYSLAGDKQSFWYWNSSNTSQLNGYHYTCFTKDGTCPDGKVYYVTNTRAPSNYDYNLSYITLTGGKKIEDAIVEMLGSDELGVDVNVKDSKIKTVLETWYAENLLDYSKYIENTVWCNDRSIGNLGQFDPNGTRISALVFAGYNNSSLTCARKLDRFTVKDEKNSDGAGNGKLTYPIGLLTKQEINLLAYNGFTGNSYWSMTPYQYFVSSSSSLSSYAVPSIAVRSATTTNVSSSVPNGSVGIRPSVSLKPGAEYIRGDGSVNNPYVIYTE